VAYREIAFDGGAPPSLWSLAPDVVVQAGTFSKLFAPGVRMGWAAGPREVIAQLAAAKQTTDQCAGALGQKLVEAYGRAGQFEQRLPAARELYASHWRAMEAALREHMPAGCRWSEPRGGFFSWLRVPEVDTVALRPAAIAGGVSYVPGAPFYAGEGGRDELRLSFSYLAQAELATAVERLAAVIENAV
jgi:2-aminoadipate transaminase